MLLSSLLLREAPSSPTAGADTTVRIWPRWGSSTRRYAVSISSMYSLCVFIGQSFEKLREPAGQDGVYAANRKLMDTLSALPT